MHEDLSHIRRHLFDQLDSVTSPTDAARFQRQLATTIMKAEDLKAKAMDRVERAIRGLDIQMCRSYGDAMVWNMLHPHTIRQLSNAEGRPPHLTSMSEVLEKYLTLVETLADNGIYAFVPDLTNTIRIGDVAVVVHHEVPMLLEMKGDLIYMQQPIDPRFTAASKPVELAKVGGRLGRQLEKMSDATEYLATGSVKPRSGGQEKRVLEVDVDITHYWHEVQEVTSGALENRDSVFILGDRHLLWATMSEPEDSNPPLKLLENVPDGTSCRIGCHLVALEECSPHVMPPYNWDLSSECRFALMEGDVVVNHLVDPSLMNGRRLGNATIIEAGVDDAETGAASTVVDVEGERIKLSGIHIYRMIYEFQNIDSVAEFMLKSASASVKMNDEYRKEVKQGRSATDTTNDV